jgi:hypothetical protein
MKKRILLVLSLIFSISTIASAQVKTVTNAELEKFRQKRVAAEKEYLATYAERGLPSPQQLEKERLEEKLRADERWAQIEKEKSDAADEDQSPLQILVLPASNDYRSDGAVTNRNYFYGATPYFYTGGYYNLPRYRSNYDRRRRYWRKNTIRPPKPIRPPRIFRQRSW